MVGMASGRLSCCCHVRIVQLPHRATPHRTALHRTAPHITSGQAVTRMAAAALSASIAAAGASAAVAALASLPRPPGMCGPDCKLYRLERERARPGGRLRLCGRRPRPPLPGPEALVGGGRMQSRSVRRRGEGGGRRGEGGQARCICIWVGARKAAGACAARSTRHAALALAPPPPASHGERRGDLRGRRGPLVKPTGIRNNSDNNSDNNSNTNNNAHSANGGGTSDIRGQQEAEAAGTAAAGAVAGAPRVPDEVSPCARLSCGGRAGIVGVASFVYGSDQTFVCSKISGAELGASFRVC